VVDARQHLLASDASDLGAALNDLFEQIVEAGRSGTVLLPNPQEGDPSTTGDGAWEITTPVEIPYYGSRNPSLALTSPTGGFASVPIRANLDREAVLFRRLPAPEPGMSGPEHDTGFTVAGFHVVDRTDTATTLLEVNDTNWVTVERCYFLGATGDSAREGSNTTDLVHIRSPGSPGDSNWHQIHRNEFFVTSGVTGLHFGVPEDNSGASQSYTSYNRIFAPKGAAGASGSDRQLEGAIGVHYDNSGGFNLGPNDFAYCDVGILVTLRDGERVRGAGSIIGPRFEGGIGPGRPSPVPIEIEDGVRGIDIHPLPNAGLLGPQFARNSIIRGTGHTLHAISSVTAKLSAGGHGFAAEWNPTGDRPPEKIADGTRFQTPTAAGGTSRLTMGGNPPAGPGQLTRCTFVGGFPSNGDATNATVRIGLRGDGGNRAMFETGEETWQVVTRDGGSPVGETPTDTGVDVDDFRRTFTICPERDQRRKPYDYRYLVDGVEVALHEGANVEPAEAVVDVVSGDGGVKTFDLREIELRRVSKSRLGRNPVGVQSDS
jgi:hypothetical protein